MSASTFFRARLAGVGALLDRGVGGDDEGIALWSLPVRRGLSIARSLSIVPIRS